DRRDEQALAADQVTEFAVDRQRNGGGQNVCGGHPEHVVDAVELADNGGQRRAEDHLVERRQQHRDHQAGEDQQDVSLVGYRCCVCAGGGVRAGCFGHVSFSIASRTSDTARCSSCSKERSVSVLDHCLVAALTAPAQVI